MNSKYQALVGAALFAALVVVVATQHWLRPLQQQAMPAAGPAENIERYTDGQADAEAALRAEGIDPAEPIVEMARRERWRRGAYGDAPQAEPQATQTAPPQPAPAPIKEPTPTTLALFDIEQELAFRTNAERIKAGLAPLLLDTGLMDATRRHTIWMASSGNFQHSDDAAENIAYGQDTAALAIDKWMHSNRHRANMLSPSYTRLGVSGFSGASGTKYWTQQFR